MANEVTLPRLGWDMEEGALGGWLKNEGDFVNAGDLLFTVEGDKAVQEIEALDSGYLRIAPGGGAAGSSSSGRQGRWAGRLRTSLSSKT